MARAATPSALEVRLLLGLRLRQIGPADGGLQLGNLRRGHLGSAHLGLPPRRLAGRHARAGHRRVRVRVGLEVQVAQGVALLRQNLGLRQSHGPVWQQEGRERPPRQCVLGRGRESLMIGARQRIEWVRRRQPRCHHRRRRRGAHSGGGPRHASLDVLVAHLLLLGLLLGPLLGPLLEECGCAQQVGTGHAAHQDALVLCLLLPCVKVNKGVLDGNPGRHRPELEGTVLR
mmetsp:Transcript_108820/g.234331  ORF Transcript_108820/g.234331 Transcript_108820/m.234331 type:complete len:230 (+) Transcript_108820:645-1334(+)